MLPKTLLLIASAALSIATPVGRRQEARPGPNCASRPKPVLPVNGGDRELAAPLTNLTLKAIALGFGIQNYTCAETGAEAKATGALAMLYDITPLYPGQSRKSLTLETFNALTTTAIWNHDVPLNLEAATEDRIAGSQGASSTNPFTPDAPLKLDGLDPIPFTGHHLFNSEGKPQFILGSGNNAINIVAKKDDSISPPTGADRGPEDTGAVGWLLLSGLEGSSVGATHLYRVLTAGGNSHGCASGTGEDSVSYTATYWFYG